MENYFDNEILTLERGLTQLKTAMQRSSSSIETLEKTIGANIPLQLSSDQTSCHGELYYTISCDSDSIVNLTLDWYYQNISNAWKVGATRSVILHKMRFQDGRIGVGLGATGTNEDVAALKNGQSVSIAVNLTIQATDNFSIGT